MMPGPEVLEVLEPGFVTTVQDAGRPGLEAEGVTAGGAADAWSLGVANALAGNAPGAAALELTLVGPTVRALRTVTVALAGTIAGHVVEGSLAVAPGSSVTLREGWTLRLDGPATGARGYLAVPGGIDVPVVLGSRSTASGAAFGGIEGRPLRPGDRLRCLAVDPVGPDTRWPGSPAPEPATDSPIRVVAGPEAGEAFDLLVRSAWTVAPASDRMGLRLDGPALDGAWAGEQPSRGVVAGTVQLPPDGRPIVLLADHQPTGGYPVPAVVIRADVPRLGQLAPGTSFRFARTDRNLAREALVAHRRAWEDGLAAMREAASWDDLWRWARG